MAIVSIALGVALAFAVHLINASALAEFASAVRSVNGQPDLVLRGAAGGFDEQLYARVAAHTDVKLASPAIEVQTYVLDGAGQRFALRIIGLDPLLAAQLAPGLMPVPATGRAMSPAALFAPDALYLNPAASARLGTVATTVKAQFGDQLLPLNIAGSVAADGSPLAVMDIADAQLRFGRLGRLDSIDLRLQPGTDQARLLQDLALPAGVRAAKPDEAVQRISNLSRAYRVNLTVLALVALFTGTFLVFSVLSLSVAQRLPQLALLGVLGLSSGERLQMILLETLVLGLIGSALGVALGTGLAATALQLLGGDLGSGMLGGAQPQLQFSLWAALGYGSLGVLAALVGGYLPARWAQGMAPAQVLKGLGQTDASRHLGWLGPVLLLSGAGLAQLPPWHELPLAAYGAVAALLIGGILCVPEGVALLLRLAPKPRHALALLALERARDQRHSATVAVAGVVVSLSLAVALTVMVGSFRGSIMLWLDTVLPAELYARTADRSAANDTAFLPPSFIEAARRLPGVTRVEAQRTLPLLLDPQRPGVALIAKPLDAKDPRLPLIGPLFPARPGLPSVYVSEAMVTLYQARQGSTFKLPLRADQAPVEVWVRGVWRDYARQHGSVMMDAADFVRLTGDTRGNDLALWLEPGAAMAPVQAGLRALLPDPSLIEFASAREIREMSLKIFDRSFAVTYWLQAVAIAIGLFGIAASHSAQVLARRKEFGLLAHLGVTKGQILTLVAMEGAVWTLVGTVLGLALGLLVSMVLVFVVNPQSFNWTMELHVPWARLSVLAAAVLLAGTVTGVIAGRSAARRDLAQSVKEDW
ncbi:MAG: ABC transporter permease [Burkholderiaceae bacterium]|nr:ABC transporter permease [Burkholderiaceae bacterium]